MPKRVDHEERRQLLAQTVAEVISTRGLEAVTVRSIADTAGYSTKLVSRYFSDKRSLLLYSYEQSAHRARLRVLDALRTKGGDVMEAVSALLPINDSARRDWQVWFAFWGMAIADTEFSTSQVAQLQKARALLTPMLRKNAAPRISRDESDELAGRLLTTIIGVAIQAVHEPEGWPASRQRAYIARTLGELVPK